MITGIARTADGNLVLASGPKIITHEDGDIGWGRTGLHLSLRRLLHPWKGRATMVFLFHPF